MDFGTGDMEPEAFRREAHRLADWIADYFAAPERFPVLARVQPGDIRSALPASPPEHAESFDAIFADFERVILPGITHWNHPGFFAYFAISGSAPGVLAEFLAAALNQQAMLWRTSPSATELEEVALRWLRQLVGLPDSFEGIRQADQLTQPLQRHLFELGRSRGRSPEHRLLVERGRQELREHAGTAPGDGEIRKETGMIPVSDAGQDDAFEVREDGVEGLGLFGSGAGKGSAQVARLDARENRIAFGRREVVGDPVGDPVGLLAEGLRIHVAQRMHARGC